VIGLAFAFHCGLDDDDNPMINSHIVDLDRREIGYEWPDLLQSAAFGPSDTPAAGLVAVDDDGEVELREVATGELLSTSTFDDFVWGVRFSRDGRWLTSAGSVARVMSVDRILGGASPAEATEFVTALEGGPVVVAVADNMYLASTHGSDEVRLWNIESGTEWFTLRTDTGNLVALGLSHDGKSLYYETADGVMRRVPLGPEVLSHEARGRTFRDFNREECIRYLPDDVDCSQYE
jgi:hypothetical protein